MSHRGDVRTVHVAALNTVPFLPYIHGLLCSAVISDPELAAEYRFGEPAFLLDSIDKIAARMADADVLALSCYVWNFRKHMKLARLVKQQNPRVLVVAGGPHVPDNAGPFLRAYPAVDIAVHGEGELAFQDILRQRSRAVPDWDAVAGVSFRHGQSICSTPARPRQNKIIELASPYTSGLLDGAIAACRRRGVDFYALWETNRGCPFRCTFCDWGSATMSQVRRFSDEQLAADIEFFGRNQVSHLFICDANFGMLRRDPELADQIAAARRRYGFPRQVRVNFAKNSNERVFRISETFYRNDLFMGTTLSMQSVNMDVLDAIERTNIGLDSYRDLQRRYASAGIPTYTELILGLPRESKQTFIRGLGEVLESGNHEDVRVFELALLPNAPINTAETRQRYGLQTIEKDVYLSSGDTPDDERETTTLVIATSTMNANDWVYCRLLADVIQCLHNGCLTRYLAIHARRGYDRLYEQFYVALLDHALARPESVLGCAVTELARAYRAYRRDPRIPQLQLIASQPAMLARVAPFGRRRGWRPEQWMWLCVIQEYRRWRDELAGFVEDCIGPRGPLLDEVLRYQHEVILQPDYDPDTGKIVQYAYDFPGYFSGRELCARPTIIHYRDIHMGSHHQYRLQKGDLKAFAKAAVGESYPFVRIRHFQHQLDCASVDVSMSCAAQEDHAAGTTTA